jgi:AraC family transcriptional regulator, activator of mtrCDE
MRWRSNATDVLTTVIETLRVRGFVICRSELRGPWGMKLHAPGVAHFHVVERGRCFLRIRGMRRPVLLEAGDLAMVPHDIGHILSDPENPPAQAMIALDELETPGARRYVCNAGCGAETRLICGAFRFEGEEVQPLLSQLTSVLPNDQLDAHGLN